MELLNEEPQKGGEVSATAGISYQYSIEPWGGVGGNAYYIWPPVVPCVFTLLQCAAGYKQMLSPCGISMPMISYIVMGQVVMVVLILFSITVPMNTFVLQVEETVLIPITCMPRQIKSP